MMKMGPESPLCFCSQEQLPGKVANIGQRNLGVGYSGISGEIRGAVHRSEECSGPCGRA